MFCSITWTDFIPPPPRLEIATLVAPAARPHRSHHPPACARSGWPAAFAAPTVASAAARAAGHVAHPARLPPRRGVLPRRPHSTARPCRAVACLQVLLPQRLARPPLSTPGRRLVRWAFSRIENLTITVRCAFDASFCMVRFGSSNIFTFPLISPLWIFCHSNADSFLLLRLRTKPYWTPLIDASCHTRSTPTAARTNSTSTTPQPRPRLPQPPEVLSERLLHDTVKAVIDMMPALWTAWRCASRGRGYAADKFGHVANNVDSNMNAASRITGVAVDAGVLDNVKYPYTLQWYQYTNR